MDPHAEMRLEPIGVVRSAYLASSDVPLEGGTAVIEIDPRYAAALDGVERSTHLFVIGYLHLADRAVLQSRPRRIAPDAPLIGVFACRSPARPNPLSLSAVRLVRREGLRLTVAPLDLVDGTPVVDIKPYSPGWDDVFAARHERRVPPAALSDELLAAFLGRALAFHLGDDAEHPAAQVALRAVLVAVRRLDVDSRDPALRVGVPRLDVGADAIVGLTGASFGGGRLRLVDGAQGEALEFSVGERRLRLRPREIPPPPLSPAEWAAGFEVEEG